MTTKTDVREKIEKILTQFYLGQGSINRDAAIRDILDLLSSSQEQVVRDYIKELGEYLNILENMIYGDSSYTANDMLEDIRLKIDSLQGGKE